MRGLLAFATLGLYVVFLSTLEPDTGRWFAIGLLLFVVLTPAIGRRVQPTAEEVGSPAEGKAD